MLVIEQFHPLLRTEAHRLLGHARAALGCGAAACEAAERAAAEAAGAKYAWLEMRSLRDMLAWCEEAEAEGVRSRLCDAVGPLVATGQEVADALGEVARL